jgi:hypothetical protein
VFYGVYGKNDELTLSAYDALMQLEIILDSGLDRVEIALLPSMLLQLELNPSSVKDKREHLDIGTHPALSYH